jgi:UDP-glucose 4-epimerase
MKKVLVTGGAGYIGANICKVLLAAGYQVRVLDDFSNGLQSRLEGMNVDLIRGDILDRQLLLTTMKDIDAVIHLAAKKSVEESLESPFKYYETNFSGTLNVLTAMIANNVSRIVFSSTAVVYKSNSAKALSESDVKEPLSPYAHSKLLSEQILALSFVSNQISSVSLRYFNVVGAGGSNLGDNARDNLVPKTFAALRLGVLPEIYGDDYSTRDGTCVRDYVHVVDLAEAHLMALEIIDKKKFAIEFNVGSGIGYTVKEVMEQIKESSGLTFIPKISPRRSGDPEILIADISAIKREIGWEPRLGLKSMIDSSWAAESSNS